MEIKITELLQNVNLTSFAISNQHNLKKSKDKNYLFLKFDYLTLLDKQNFSRFLQDIELTNYQQELLNLGTITYDEDYSFVYHCPVYCSIYDDNLSIIIGANQGEDNAKVIQIVKNQSNPSKIKYFLSHADIQVSLVETKKMDETKEVKFVSLDCGRNKYLIPIIKNDLAKESTNDQLFDAWYNGTFSLCLKEFNTPNSGNSSYIYGQANKMFRRYLDPHTLPQDGIALLISNGEVKHFEAKGDNPASYASTWRILAVSHPYTEVTLEQKKDGITVVSDVLLKEVTHISFSKAGLPTKEILGCQGTYDNVGLLIIRKINKTRNNTHIPDHAFFLNSEMVMLYSKKYPEIHNYMFSAPTNSSHMLMPGQSSTILDISNDQFISDDQLTDDELKAMYDYGNNQANHDDTNKMLEVKATIMPLDNDEKNELSKSISKKQQSTQNKVKNPDFTENVEEDILRF